MPRIRTIKPELWQDEKLAVLDPLTRLVFLGLISMADDAGRLVDNVKSIDGFIFPETEDSAKDALGILARLSRILRYEASNGQRVIQITNWQRHQRVDHPNKYVLPPPPLEVVAAVQDTPISVETRENSARITTKSLATTSTSTPTSTNDPDPDLQTQAAGAGKNLSSHTHLSCMALVVERLYRGARPPDGVMATNGSILRNFAAMHGYDRMATIIEGLALRRDRGELHGVGPTAAVSLKWLNSAKMDLNQLAVSEDAAYRTEPPARKGKGGLTDLGSVIANLGRTG